MVTPKTRRIAKELENLGRQKIRLAEAVLEKPLPEDEKDKLYAAAIRDQFGLIFELCTEIKFHDLYMALQMEEMYSDENVYYTTKDLHLDRDPTDEEIKDHYIDCGRPSRFRDLFKQLELDPTT
jgi:hypothetical protein